MIYRIAREFITHIEKRALVKTSLFSPEHIELMFVLAGSPNKFRHLLTGKKQRCCKSMLKLVVLSRDRYIPGKCGTILSLLNGG